MRRAIGRARRRTSRLTLRITTTHADHTTCITLEGRIAGPWAAELGRAWRDLAPSLTNRKLTIDLRNATYADTRGLEVLRGIYAGTRAELVTNTPWTRYLAEEITRKAQHAL